MTSLRKFVLCAIVAAMLTLGAFLIDPIRVQWWTIVCANFETKSSESDNAEILRRQLLEVPAFQFGNLSARALWAERTCELLGMTGVRDRFRNLYFACLKEIQKLPLPAARAAKEHIVIWSGPTGGDLMYLDEAILQSELNNKRSMVDTERGDKP
jgi:hypothetical protein